MSKGTLTDFFSSPYSITHGSNEIKNPVKSYTKLCRKIITPGEYHVESNTDYIIIRSPDIVTLHLPILEDVEIEEGVTSTKQLIIKSFTGTCKHILLSDHNSCINEISRRYEFNSNSTLILFSFGKTWYVSEK